MTRIALASLALASICGLAHADTYTGGSGGNLVDASADNSSTGFGNAQFTLNASNAGAPVIAVFNSISITMGHSYVGDLVITLTSPGGQTADILARPGVTAPNGYGSADNLGTSSSSSAGTATYIFVNAGGTPFPTGATALGIVPAGTYNRSSAANATVVATGASGNDFSIFNGTNLNGIWTLTVRDFAGGDTGSVVSWSLDIASRPVPTPGAAAMLGLGALSATRRKRR